MHLEICNTCLFVEKSCFEYMASPNMLIEPYMIAIVGRLTFPMEQQTIPPSDVHNLPMS